MTEYLSFDKQHIVRVMLVFVHNTSFLLLVYVYEEIFRTLSLD